ncbi:MAG: hypothetical protein OSA99_11350 [Acidimicrobiales bacterium]|nr:hypothetical protein [Acidimicrobiales bacterium]
MTLFRRSLFAVTATAALLAGCGGGDAGRFDDEVTAVRVALANDDPDGARAALDAIDAAADDALADGSIDERDRQELADLVASSRALLDEVVPTTTTTTTTSAPPPKPDDKDDKDDKKKDDKKKDDDDKEDDDD